MKSPMSQNLLILYRVLETNHPTFRRVFFFPIFSNSMKFLVGNHPCMVYFQYVNLKEFLNIAETPMAKLMASGPPSGHAAGWCPAAASRRGRGSSELADGARGGRELEAQRVDGWNPVKSPVEVKVVYHSMMIIPLFTGFGIHPTVRNGISSINSSFVESRKWMGRSSKRIVSFEPFYADYGWMGGRVDRG